MIIDYKFLLLDENNILNEKYISEEFSYRVKKINLILLNMKLILNKI